MAWEKLGTASVSGATANTAWKELDRVTLGSAGDTLDTGTFTAKDNIMILEHKIPSGSCRSKYRFNADSGSNYAERRCDNGGSDGTSTSLTNLQAYHSGGTAQAFSVHSIVNNTSQEKLLIGHIVENDSVGAGNSPNRQEYVGKWANTSAQINRVELFNDGSGSFDTGSELVVLGYDNDEADSGTNFWQELASVTRTDNGSTLESGNFATKKYLMVEFCSIPANNGFKGRWEFGHSNGTMDTGSNYAQRWQDLGASDSTGTSEATFYGYTNDDDAIQHGRAFIINKADKEKLVIFEGSSGGSTTGAGNAPSRREVVAKWVNTSNQITNIRLNNQIAGGDASSGSFIKVYGAD